MQNRLANVRINGQLVAEYRYSSLGQRVAKLTDQGFTTYLYGPDGQLLGESEYDATGSRQRSQSYLWLDSLPLASVQAQGSAPAKVLYLHSDHLNTPRLATSAGQQIVWQWQSDAFGNGTANQDPQGSGQPTVLNLRFPGQYFDAESGLHYNYFRDYDPQTGRYVESDPIGLEGGLNVFSYALLNPIAKYDPFGLFVPSDKTPAGVAAMSEINGTVNAAGVGVAAEIGGKVKKTPEERDLNRRKNMACKSPDIKTGDPCVDAKSRLARLNLCLDLRREYRDRFGEAHSEEVINTVVAVKRAEDTVRKVCKEECEK